MNLEGIRYTFYLSIFLPPAQPHPDTSNPSQLGQFRPIHFVAIVQIFFRTKTVEEKFLRDFCERDVLLSDALNGLCRVGFDEKGPLRRSFISRVHDFVFLISCVIFTVVPTQIFFSIRFTSFSIILRN